MDLKQIAGDADTILIAGHLRPDGDCTGACVAACRYLRNAFPEKKIDVYLETLPKKFGFLDADGVIISNEVQGERYDLFLALDSSTPDRLGDAEKIFDNAKRTFCIDHHVSNDLYAMDNLVEPSASSTCEVLFGIMDEKGITYEIAEALYIGIIFDTGVFRHSNTSRKTMEIAGKLMEKGLPFWDYIDKCFYERSYTQTQLLGRALLASMRMMDGKCICAVITRRMMEFYEAEPDDTDGIIDQLRITRGVEVAVLLHETGEQEYKVSMRSNNCIDVSKIATYFGGGGHVKAAGFSMRGSAHDVMNNITEHIELQMQESSILLNNI